MGEALQVLKRQRPRDPETAKFKGTLNYWNLEVSKLRGLLIPSPLNLVSYDGLLYEAASKTSPVAKIPYFSKDKKIERKGKRRREFCFTKLS